MEILKELEPIIISTIFLLISLFIVCGTKYKLLKSILILIPFIIVICGLNVLLILKIGHQFFLLFYMITLFVPLSISYILVSKEKGFTLFAQILNVFLGYCLLVLLRTIAMHLINNYLILNLLTYFIFMPLILCHLYFFIRKAINFVTTKLKKFSWFFALYSAVVTAQILVYRLIIYKTDNDILDIELVGIGILSIYIISIIGFSLFIHAYDNFVVAKHENLIYKKQVHAIKVQAKEKQEKENQLRILRHDMKHLLINVSNLIKNNNIDEALDLINNYNIEIEKTSSIQFCQDVYINSVLQYYQGRCDRHNIKYYVKINHFEDALPVEAKELAMIISNCLDNAINASLKLKDNRYISFILNNNNGRIILQVKNRFNGDVEYDKDHNPTSNKLNHGFGTKSIESFAKKHKIYLDYIIKEDIFEVTFIFNEK